jgi:drug/metabolite transporter (DMT)-like permease
MYLLLPAAPHTVTKPIGYLYGSIVGATYAVMLIAMRYAKDNAGKSYPEILSLALIFIVSTLTIAIDSVFIEHASLLVPSMSSHLLMAATALVCQTIGWYLIKITITRIPAYEGSLLLILQPILATIWGIMFFGEPLSLVQLSGVIMASAGIIVYQLSFASKSRG